MSIVAWLAAANRFSLGRIAAMARSHADARENPLVVSIIVIIYVLFLLRVRLNATAVGAGCTRLYCIVSIRIELAKEFFLLCS